MVLNISFEQESWEKDISFVVVYLIMKQGIIRLLQNILIYKYIVSVQSMSKQMLSKFRRSLTESSNVITDTPTSSPAQYSHHQSPTTHPQQYINKQYSSYSDDQLNLIKKIPQLISQNDELKQKITELQAYIVKLQTKNRRKVNLFANYEQEQYEKTKQLDYIQRNSQKMMNLMASAINSRQLMNNYRLSRSNVSRKHELDARQSQKQEIQALNNKIKSIQQQNHTLKIQNKHFFDKEAKYMRQKQMNKHDIDHILNKFDSILQEKTLFGTEQMKILQQKCKALEDQHQTVIIKYDQIVQQNSNIRKELENHNLMMNQCNNLRIEVQKMYYVIQNYENHAILAENTIKINQNIRHLWRIKEIQYGNIVQLLNSTNQKAPQ